MKVPNIFLTKQYIGDTKEVHLMKNWLGRLGMQFIETLTAAEQELCKNGKGMFDTLSENTAFAWAKIIKAQWSENAMPESLKYMKEFFMI